jgi:CheY-like chemotaxis protein
MKILIADDNAAFRAFLRRLLADVTTDIDECDSGQAALAAYARKRPDFVLMDLRMEPMDGLTATRAILARDRAARVVIVTSFDDESLREAARRAGAHAYAAKDDLSALRSMLVEP